MFSGCDIQDAADGNSGMMTHMRLLKTLSEEEANSVRDN